MKSLEDLADRVVDEAMKAVREAYEKGRRDGIEEAAKLAKGIAGYWPWVEETTLGNTISVSIRALLKPKGGEGERG